jgi:hypothetical protein
VSPRRSRRLVLLGAVTTIAVAVALVFAGVARAGYWDFQGYLYNPCCPISYGESQPIYTGLYQIRISRSNCAAKMQIWGWAGGVWVQVYFGCDQSDIRWSYDSASWSASRAINGTSGTSVYANVRIDRDL